MFVKPAPGLIVRDPLHMTPIPADGREVPDINYWFQRLRDGDLVPATAPAEPVAPVEKE
jgi:hypothetical protein